MTYVDIDDLGALLDADRHLAAQLASLAEEKTALTKDLDEHAAELTALRDKIHTQLQERIGDAHEARILGRPVITWKPHKATTTFDQTAFRAAHADLWEAFQKPKASPRPFKILPPEEDPR